MNKEAIGKGEYSPHKTSSSSTPQSCMNISSRMKEIAPLQEKVSSLIRATSCISTIHSITQELIMNSIDSGASSINIVIGSDDNNSNNFSVSVIDNGDGIPKEQMKHLGLWHYSSKSQDEKTLGFRGEALASIASFAKVTITSKTKHFNESSPTLTSSFRSFGSEATLDVNSRSIILTPTPSKITYSSGTIVQVYEIFNNIPVRKNIININNEIQKIKSFICNMSLLRHNIGWSITKRGVRRSILSIKPQVSVAGRIIEQFGQDIMAKMLPISVSLHDFNIKGFMSPLNSENCHWNKSYQALFLNGRWLNSNYLFSGSFNYIYNSLLSSNRSGGPAAKHFNPFSSQVKHCPAFVLQIQCSSDSYDILSEPDKTYPLFHNCSIVKELIYLTILKTAAAVVNSSISEAKISQFMESFSLSNYGRVCSLKFQAETETCDANESAAADNISIYIHEDDGFSHVNQEEKSNIEVINYAILSGPKLKSARITPADIFDCAFTLSNTSNLNGESPHSTSDIPIVDCNENSGLGKRFRLNENSFIAAYNCNNSNNSNNEYGHSVEISRDTSRENRIDSYFTGDDAAMEYQGYDGADESKSCNVSLNDAFDNHRWGKPCPQFNFSTELDDVERTSSTVASDNSFFDQDNNDKESLFYSVTNSSSKHNNNTAQKHTASTSTTSATVASTSTTSATVASTSTTSATVASTSSATAILSSITNVSLGQPSRLYKFDNKISKSLLKSARFLGQVDSKYILMATSNGNLIAMDQHAASERVLYEKLDLNIQSKVSTTKIVDYVVTLSHNEAEFAEKNMKTIQFWGFEFEVLWNRSRCKSSFVSVRILKVAQIHGEPLTAEDFREYIVSLMSKGDLLSDILQKPPAFHRIIASKSCKSAVKFGDNLSVDECINLIADLSTTALPFQCAHGRPSIAPLVKVRTDSSKSSLNFSNVMNSLNSSLGYGVGVGMNI